MEARKLKRRLEKEQKKVGPEIENIEKKTNIN